VISLTFALLNAYAQSGSDEESKTEELAKELVLWRKDFPPVEPPPQADLSFLFLLGAPRFA
jgi:hypothetical protein